MYLKTSLLICLTGLLSCCLHAQVQQSEDMFQRTILPKLEERWEQPGGDTAIYYTLEQVRYFCGGEGKCLSQMYDSIVRALELRANLPMAIFVGEELLKVARRQGDLQTEARTYSNLDRFHNALGNDRMAIANLENALRLYEQLGRQSSILRIKMRLTEYRGSYLNAKEVLSEMEAVLTQARQNKDTLSLNHFYQRLIPWAKEAGAYDKLEEYIVALENVPLSKPFRTKEYGMAIHIARGRASLFMNQKKWAEAERFYQKALRLCEEAPDKWLEIDVLQSLSEAAWKQGSAARAKFHLDEAEQKAEKVGFDDLLAVNYEQKARIAEAEGRFADAVRFIKKQQFHNDKFKAPNAGFNMQNYYLQREKEQLATAQKNQELELQLRHTQLRTTFVIAALAILLAGLLFAGWQRQRRAKQALAAQNTLIQRQSEELKSLDVAKSRFFANVSHELRTPLTLLLGPIDTALKSGTLDHRNSTLLTMARQGGEDLLKRVGALLDLSKLEQDKMVLKESPAYLFPLLQRLVSIFESHAEYLGLGLTLSYRADQDLQLAIDQEKIEIILNNLLSNAFKFTGTGGQIEVSVEDRADQLLIAVRDTGRGISLADLPHVFDRFFQSGEKNAPAEGGTGIGLALCRELVTLMGGKIWATSTLGRGSTFFVELPKKEVQIPKDLLSEHLPRSGQATSAGLLSASEMPAPGDRSAFIPPPSSGHGTTILVVEDNYSLRDYLRIILSPHYQVITAKNGQEALDLLRTKAHNIIPSLILSDLMMPVMDGYQLLEELKSDDATRQIPVIMLTARADARDKLKALRIGVDDYLTKPFDEEELLVRIENLLQNRAARTEIATEMETATAILSPESATWLEEFETFVRKNVANDLLSVPMLAHEFAKSESSLLRELKRLTGLSTVQYLQEIRLDEARRLLESHTCDTIAMVASKVGYTEVRSFSRIFKQRFGKLPSDYLNA